MSRCAACQADNLADSLFCTECGAKLEVACGSCGVGNLPSAKYCRKCGHALAESTAPAAAGTVLHSEVVRDTRDDHLLSPRKGLPGVAYPRADIPRHLADKMLQSKPALEGERKQVTVLFVDVKGSMDLAEQLGPEEWHAILERFFQLLADGVHRFEGTVNQYTGDGIMALFGAPIAHEDHAQRACHAALHLREELRTYAHDLRRTRGLNFSTRMGLNSGDVVVGKIGDDLQMDYTALGHTVGLAQRMEQLAEPRAVYLAAHTARLVEGYFALRSLGAFTIKGSHEPLEVYALEGPGGARTHFELSRARGLSKFVGREAELATLEAALERGNAGHGQTVGIVAEAGTGKSRLCFEFLERCRARGMTVYEGRGVAHGARIPLLPMLELFRSFFGIEQADTDLAAREKIAGRLLLLDESLRDDLPIFFDMLGVPDPARPLPPTDPELLQRRAYAAIRAIVRAEGERPLPAILMLEDLQWLDATSDAFVAQMIEAQATCRGLTLVNFRPGYKADWMTSSSYQQLPLVPLGQDAVRELLADLLGCDSSVTELSGPVHQRAAGNPFFVEEIVQNLVETRVLEGSKGSYRLRGPAATVTLPDTVQVVLAARIDRLQAREKRLLQQAAVIGKTVPERILKHIANLADVDYQPAMRALRESDFLYEESLYPQVVYGFKHPLTHEVAYRTQLRERRVQTHASVARVIEELGEGRLDEAAALIAHHWEEAGEKTTAARWHARAARWIGIRDYAQAFAHWRRVADLTGDDGAPVDLALRAEAFRMLPVLAYRTETSDEEQAAFFEQGRRFLERIGDERSLAAFMVAYAGLRQNACDLRGYEQVTREACRIAERCGELALGAAVRPDRLWSLYRLGRLQEALAVAEEIVVMTGGDVELGADICGYSPYFMSHILGGPVLVELGRLREARERAESGVQIALVRGPDESLCWAHVVHVLVLDGVGECGPVVAGIARLALEAAERSGSPQALVCAQSAALAAGKCNGDWSAAMTAAEAALRVSRTKRVARDFEFKILGDYAEALLGAGEIERAVEVATEVAELAQDRGALVHRCHALVVLARCLRERHGISVAGQISGLLDEVDRLVDETSAAYWRPCAFVERAELDRLRGNAESTRNTLTLAQRLFAEMGATGYVERITKELTQ